MTEQIKRKLWMPVIKNPNKPGEYLAVLSDDSLDRDDEGMDKGLIYDWEMKGLPSLSDHKNSMDKWVGGWENLKARENKGHTALFASPWFFSKEANPLAPQIKKQVEEAFAKGVKPGVSIGFIAHDSEMRKIDGKERRIFTKGELVEASWIPIQSNRNASYGHIAKRFNFNGQSEEENMKEFEQKDIDSAVEKAKIEFSKQLESKSAEVTKLNENLKDLKKECDSAKEKVIATEKSLVETTAELEKAKKVSLEKQQFIDEANKSKEVNTQEFDQKTKMGQVPIMTM